MPRQSKGARLWYDKSTALWYIRDGTAKRGTGCGLAERARAEEALAAFIADKYEPPRDSRPAQLLVADVLTFYTREIATKQRSQATSYAVEALLKWWGDKALTDVKSSTCQAYAVFRTAQPVGLGKGDPAERPRVKLETARRELTVLRAAINAYHKETPLDALPVVVLPEASAPRTRWLTRQEAVAMLRASRQMDDKDGGRALARFILLGLYTGTRSGALRRLGWMPNTLGGWIDVEGGIIHRRGDEEKESKKRLPSARIPDRLLGTLRRWKRADLRKNDPEGKPRQVTPWLIHYRGQPVEKQRKTWARACQMSGLPKSVTPHVLRHTAVTWMMLAGNDPYDVAAYVGMSLKMLDDVYGHHHPDHQKKLASRIGRRA